MSRVGAAAALATLALVAHPPAADAADVTYWGCHGPAGQPLGSAPFAASAAGDAVADAYAGGCATAGATLAGGGLRAAFTRSDPAAPSAASWQVELPSGVAATRIALTRRTRGLDAAPVPGGGQGYLAETADGRLEARSVEDTGAPLDGSAVFTAGGRSFVRLGVRCGAPSSDRCVPASDQPVAVELGSVAVTVSDAEAPRGAVGGITSPASGTMVLRLRASDAGTGVAHAEARVDGVLVAASDLGGAACTDLSPAEAAVDLPLGGGCPADVAELELPVPTPQFGDGLHRLQVSVADAAGNRAVVADEPLTFDNTPPENQSTAVLSIGTGGPASSARSSGGGGGGAAGTGASGSSALAPGAGPACLAPRLSMFLQQKPLKVAKGVPVVRRNVRYRYSGSLTCMVGRRRVHAPAGVVVSLLNRIGRRTYRKSGVTTRSDGRLTFILAYPSSRLLEFRYTSADRTTTRVRIRISVAKRRAS